jgi:hypothetical protein
MSRDQVSKLIEALRQGVDINQISSVVVEALEHGYQDWDTPWKTGFEFGDIDFYQIADAMDERQKAAAFRAVRECKGLSLDDVARNLGSRFFKVTAQCIQDLEEGRRRTRVRSEWVYCLFAIADCRDRSKQTGAPELLLWQKPSPTGKRLDA